MASAMSETWNSSKQISLYFLDTLSARAEIGSSSPFRASSSRWISRMKWWKCTRRLRTSGTQRKKLSMRKLLPRPTGPQR